MKITKQEKLEGLRERIEQDRNRLKELNPGRHGEESLTRMETIQTRMEIVISQPTATVKSLELPLEKREQSSLSMRHYWLISRNESFSFYRNTRMNLNQNNSSSNTRKWQSES